MGRIFWREGVPGRKDILAGMSFQQKRGEKISWWEGFLILVVGNSRWEGFSGGKEFPAGKIFW